MAQALTLNRRENCTVAGEVYLSQVAVRFSGNHRSLEQTVQFSKTCWGGRLSEKAAVQFPDAVNKNTLAA